MSHAVVHVPRFETLQVNIDLKILLCFGCFLLVRVVWFIVLCFIHLSTVVCSIPFALWVVSLWT